MQPPSGQIYAVADAVSLSRLITSKENLPAVRFTAMKHLDRRIFLVQETATAEAACLRFGEILYPRIVEEFSHVLGMSGSIVPLSDRRFAAVEKSLVVSLLSLSSFGHFDIALLDLGDYITVPPLSFPSAALPIPQVTPSTSQSLRPTRSIVGVEDLLALSFSSPDFSAPEMPSVFLDIPVAPINLLSTTSQILS